MPPEERQGSFGDPDGASSIRSKRTDSVRIGLLPAPEIPEQIAGELSTELPELLSQRVDGHVSWNVSVICDPLTGSEPDAVRVIDAGYERMVEEGWDIAICLTDLPLRKNRRPVVAAVSTARRVAVLSLPPLGVTLLRRRVREAIVQLVIELYEGSPELDRDGEDRDAGVVGAGANGEKVQRPSPRPRQLVSRRLTELMSPIRRITPSDEDDIVDVRFVSPTLRGHLRMLGGMVLANRPWRLFTTMKSVIAAAFATAAYVLVMPILWQMADSLGSMRLVGLTILSITAMVVWIIIAHNLWERPGERETRDLVPLYNAATALTLAVAVLFSYAVLFALVIVGALIFLDSNFLQSNLGHSVGFGDYARLAWMATSMATVAGALGSGLEDEQTIREATYGYRQRRRNDPDDPEGSSDTS